MKNLENNAYFWQKIDTLLFSMRYEKFRLKDEVHPKFSNMVYPMEYGYLIDGDDETKSRNIGVFKGSIDTSHVNAVVVCADILQKDLDVKLLVGCTQEDEKSVLEFLNQTEFQKTILVRRSDETPEWARVD